VTADDAILLSGRVQALLSMYEWEDACVARLLCDRHEPGALAYRIASPDRPTQLITFGDLKEASGRLASALSDLGLGPGDRIATLMGKSAEYLTTILAIWRLGAVHVPLFTAFAPPAIAFRLKASDCKLVVCDAAQRPKLRGGPDFPDPAPWGILVAGGGEPGDLRFDDILRAAKTQLPAAVMGGGAPLIQIYTSGTTGTPKGVVVPVRALASFQAYAEFGLNLRRDDVFWNAADPGWGYGLYFGVLAALTTGCAGTFVVGGFSPEATYQVLTAEGVTNFAAAPTVYRSLRVAERPPPKGLRLRCASSAGEPLTPDVNEWSVSALGVVVHDHYGQTETGMLINNHHHPALTAALKPGSIGRPAPGFKVRIIGLDADDPVPAGTVGRLAVEVSESPFFWFQGYDGDPKRSAEKFSPDGRWYYTGDVGRVDADGDIFFASRDDDVIVMAGYRIGPFEVESVIMQHAAVAECAVLALPDEIRGEVLEAAVVLRDGVLPSEALTRELQNLVKTGFAAHAYPRRVHYLDTLPKTPSGKVQRFILRQTLAPVAGR
jgi:acetyl-CoA synthetase